MQTNDLWTHALVGLTKMRQSLINKEIKERSDISAALLTQISNQQCFIISKMTGDQNESMVLQDKSKPIPLYPMKIITSAEAYINYEVANSFTA